MPALRTLFALLVVASVVVADELRTVDNKTITGKVVSLDAKEVAVETNDGVVRTPLENVLAVEVRGPKTLNEQYTEIRLVDDSVLICKDKGVTFKGKNVEATLFTGQKLTFPLSSVVSVLKGAYDPTLRKAWDTIQTEKIKRDRVVLYNNGNVDALPGTLGEADEKGQTIAFKDEGGELQVPLKNITGMLFYREPRDVEAICMVYDTSGNAVVARKVVSDGTKVVVTTTMVKDEKAKEKEYIVLEVDPANVAKFDYNMGKVAFLSDIEPIEGKSFAKSAVGLVVKPRKNVNLDGDPIVLDREYKKGLSLHAHTELEYDLKGKYKKFSCVLGVDPRVGAESQAKVTFEVDGRAKYSKVITPKMIEHVDLDVSKANTLRIIVTSQNLLDLHDHVTIAIPKISQ